MNLLDKIKPRDQMGADDVVFFAEHLMTIKGQWDYERGILVVRAFNFEGNYHDTYFLGQFSFPVSKDIVRCMNVGGKAEDAAKVLRRVGVIA